MKSDDMFTNNSKSSKRLSEAGEGGCGHQGGAHRSFYCCCISLLGLGLPQQNTTDWGGFNNRNLFSHGSEVQKSKIKMSPSLISSEASLDGCLPTVSSPGLSSVHSHVWCHPLCIPMFSSCKGTSHVGLGFTLMTSFNLNHPFKGPISRCGHILRYWWLRVQYKNLGAGTQTSLCADVLLLELEDGFTGI